MLDWIQFQLDNLFHLLPFLSLRIIVRVFLQLPFSPMLPYPFICFFLFFLSASLTFQIPESHLVFFVVKLSMVELSCCLLMATFFSYPFFSFLFKSYSFHCRKCFLLYISRVPCARGPLSDDAASSTSDRTNNKNSNLMLYMNI